MSPSTILDLLSFSRSDVARAARGRWIAFLVFSVPLVFASHFWGRFFTFLKANLSPLTASGWLCVVVFGSVCVSIGFISGAYICFRERLRYRSDSFFGIKWSWGYDWHGRVCDIKAFCPRCNRAIRLETGLAGLVGHNDNYLCECGYDSLVESKAAFPFHYHESLVSNIENSLKVNKYKA